MARAGGVYELLRENIRVTDVLPGEIGDKVECVFHDDSNPSMHIYEDHAYCFACCEHGDVTKLWKAMHGFSSMWDAAQDLARRFGIELPKIDPEAKKRYEERRVKEESHARTAAKRHDKLKDPKDPIGRRVQDYIRTRGITDEIRDRFMLGATDTGHLNIPFWSGSQIHGQVIRRLDGREPKYIAPKGEDFPLGRRPLFMVGRAKPQAYVVVEGFLDQPAAEVLGIPAIGTGGSRLSKEQILDLREMGAKGATFCIIPDGDPAGIKAARENTAKLYPYAYMTDPIPAEGVKDVSDLHRRDPENAAQVLRDLMDAGKDALELAMDEMPSRPRNKVAHLKREIIPLILQLESQAEREAVIKSLAALLGLNTKIVNNAILEQEAVRVVTNEDPDEDVPESEWAELLEPGVLDRYIADVCEIKRVVGDKDKGVIKLLACDAFEAQLEPLPTGKPIGGPVMLTGESGRGKNFLADAAVCGLPEEWYLSFTAASATSFYYAAEIDPAFLKHRFVYPNEVEAIDAVIEFLRPMISQAKAKKYVTNKNSDGAFTFQEIDVEGPITGCIPTVRNKLDDQLQTRLLVVEIEDYEGRIGDHTKALSEQFVPGFIADPHGHLVPKWRAALRSLTQVRKVVIPFADKEWFKFTNEEVKHGARLWGNLLGLMCAHAWLEQRNREIRDIDATKAVVATADDYKVAYELLKSVGARSIVNIGETHRKIVRAVYDLKEAEDTDDARKFGSVGFGVREIAKKAGISPGTVSKNRAFLTRSVGLLYEPEDGGGRLQIAPDVDPEALEAGAETGMTGFPDPAEVAKWAMGDPVGDTRAGGGNNGNTETLPQKPDTYSEKVFPGDGNTQETVETLSPNPDTYAEKLFAEPGNAPENGHREASRIGEPLSGDLKPGESTMLEEERYETADNLIRELRATGVSLRVVDGNLRYHPATVVNEFGSSELKRCEAEVIELLTEEAEAEAAWEAMLAAVPETDRLPNEEYEGLLELDLEHQKELFEWIEDNIMPAPEGAERYRHGSYELKHVFEREGFYVTDEQFRAAMWLSGYHGRRYPGRRYEDIETRFYFVQPNTDGILRRLVDRGAVSGWARRALLD